MGDGHPSTAPTVVRRALTLDWPRQCSWSTSTFPTWSPDRSKAIKITHQGVRRLRRLYHRAPGSARAAPNYLDRLCGPGEHELEEGSDIAAVRFRPYLGDALCISISRMRECGKRLRSAIRDGLRIGSGSVNRRGQANVWIAELRACGFTDEKGAGGDRRGSIASASCRAPLPRRAWGKTPPCRSPSARTISQPLVVGGDDRGLARRPAHEGAGSGHGLGLTRPPVLAKLGAVRVYTIERYKPAVARSRGGCCSICASHNVGVRCSATASKGWPGPRRPFDPHHRHRPLPRSAPAGGWSTNWRWAAILIVPVGRDPTNQVIERNRPKSEEGLHRDTLDAGAASCPW